MLNIKKILLVLLPFALTAQGYAYDSVNVRARWMIYHDGYYEKIISPVPDSVKVVFFSIQPREIDHGPLVIRCEEKSEVFINGEIFGLPDTTFTISKEQLQRFTSAEVLIGVYGNRLNALETYFQKPKKKDSSEKRTADAFSNFVVLMVLLILILYIIGLQLSPKAAVDFFSVRQILNRREGDETGQQGSSRSVNLIFHSLAILLISFFLVMMFTLLPAHTQLMPREIQNFGPYVFHWSVILLIVLTVILVKWLIIFVGSLLFHFQDTLRMHFQNWTRLVLLFFVPVLAFSVGIFLISGNRSTAYNYLFHTLIFLFVLWIGLLFYKLSARSGSSLFHIISYICITELIPLLIISKILYE